MLATVRTFVLVVFLFASTAFMLGFAGCSSSEPVEEDPYTEFDHELRERLATDLPREGGSQAFLTNRFRRDRAEFREYVELFRHEDLGANMRRDLISYATAHNDRFLRANISYLLVQANFTEIHSDVLANLEHENDYVRYRAVLSLPFIIGPHELDVLLPWLGEGEPSSEVREAARGVFADLVGPEEVDLVFEALKAAQEDWKRAEFLAEIFNELLDELPRGRREQVLQQVSEHFGEGLDAVDAFLLMRRAGAFEAQHVEALSRIVADGEAEPELRQRAHRELVDMLEAGGTRAQAVHDHASRLRFALLSQLDPRPGARVFEPEAVRELVDPLGLDQASAGVLRSQVESAELSDWRLTDERDTVATVLLARHAPRSDWLTEKLIEGMRNPDIVPAASQALLRDALELKPDSPEQVTLVEAAARGLTDGREHVALSTAEGLAALGSKAAIDALLAGMEETNPDVVAVCADALLSLADSEYLVEQRIYTLWELIRERNRHIYEPYHMIQALRVIEEIGDQSDLEFFTHYCAVASTSSEVREAFEQAERRLRERDGQ